jgi:hypothetical protein
MTAAQPSSLTPAQPVDPLADLDLSEVAVQQVITCTIEGFLEPSDLAQLIGAGASEPTAKAQTAAEGIDIARLRERHHSVARLIANNFAQNIVCQITGYTDAYLSTLLKNPAMQDLIGHYRAQHNNAAEVVGEKLRTTAMRAVEALSDRLDEGSDSENALSNNDLIALAKLGLDRSGHGPTSTQINKNLDVVVDYAELAKLNRAAKATEDDLLLPAPIEELMTDTRNQVSETNALTREPVHAPS